MRYLSIFLLLFPMCLFGQATRALDADSLRQPIAETLDTSGTEGNEVADRLSASPETVLAERIVWVTPKKTAFFSAIVPGMGQVYNGHYWKLPIIYGGLGAAGYLIYSNLNDYNTFRRIYAGRVSGDPRAYDRYPDYSNEVVKNARDFYRRNLDLTVFLTIVGYGLQIVDALVFAQLKNFDISPDISFHTRPVVTPQGGFGLGLVMHF